MIKKFIEKLFNLCDEVEPLENKDDEVNLEIIEMMNRINNTLSR
ncbi:hypothetical protein [Clostridium hydrogeniformans]|nr:hypothetical protein [Clostridium hydrogeniformans]